MLKRKIYSKLVDWKKNDKGKTALLIEGARHIGQSTIVEEFAKKIGYEIPFNGRIFRTNKDNLRKLEDKDWNKN